MDIPTFEYKSKDYSDNLNLMRMKDYWCDVTIIANNTKYRAHKAILAANLKYFKTRLLSSPEARDQDVIEMTGVNVTDPAVFILYAYTGKILLTVGNVLSLLKDAQQLREDEIKEACIKFVKDYFLKTENACYVHKFGSTINCEPLKKFAARNIVDNFEGFSKNTDFLDLDYESLKNILCCVQSNFQYQKKYFKGIVRWILTNVQSRRNYLDDLLSLIDMSQLTAAFMMKYLEKNVQRNDLFDVVQNLISCYRTSKLLKNRQRGILIMQDTKEKEVGFQFYDLISKKWSQLRRTSLPHDVDSFDDGSVLDDKLCFISSSGLHFFDFTTETFDSIYSTSSVLKQHKDAMCTSGKFLYMYGFSNELWKIDPVTNSFVKLTDTECKEIRRRAVIFYRDCVHILGGSDGRHALDSVFTYDTKMKKRRKCLSMLQGRYEHACAVLDGKLYACGGVNTNSVESYCSKDNRWETVASMNKQRNDFLVVAYEGKLYAIGGDAEVTVEVYDPSENQWQMDQDMSSGLRLMYPRGGFISEKCFQQRALKRPSEQTHAAPSNCGDDGGDAEPPTKMNKK